MYLVLDLGTGGVEASQMQVAQSTIRMKLLIFMASTIHELKGCDYSRMWVSAEVSRARASQM